MPLETIKANTIAITGHRDYPDRAGLYRGLDRLKADRYLLGGARGVDTDALEYLKKTQPGSNRTVVVPNELRHQPVATQASTRANASNVVELKNTGSGRFMDRNRYLVNHADRVAAFTDGRTTGGTFNTIEYANARGVPVDIMTLVEVDEAAIMAMEQTQFEAWLKSCGKANVPLMAIKGIAIKRMKLMSRAAWPVILKQLHQLR